MNLTTWVTKHRHTIDECVRDFTGRDDGPANDDEREDWVLNDEYLYNLALDDGVNLEDDDDE